MLSASQKLLEESNGELRIELHKRRDDSEKQEKIWSEQVGSQFGIVEKLKGELNKAKNK